MQHKKPKKIEKQDSIDIKTEILKYVKYWRWFLLSTIITISLALLYIKTTDKTYAVNTTILIKEDNKSDLSSQLAAFSNLGLGGGKNNIENEIEILKSRTLSESVIDSLKMNYFYYQKDGFKKSPFFKNSPICIDFIPKIDEKEQIKSITFEFENITNSKFDLIIKKENKGTYTFGEKINTEFGVLSVKKSNNSFPINKNDLNNLGTIYVDYTITELISFNTRKNTVIAPITKTSSVVKIELNSKFPKATAEYLNTLVEYYNEQGINDKKDITKYTSEFISNRLNIIAEELGDVEKNVENYKNQNNLTDIKSEVELFLNNLTGYERSVVQNETEINIVSELINYLKKSKNEELIPNIILSSNSTINSSIDNLNSLILEKQRQLNNSTKEHPRIIELETTISSSKNNILSALKNNLNSLKIVQHDLKKQENQMQSKLSQVPKQEREFRIIDRQQKVKEALYLFLLQKREENAIALAASELKAKVIDKAIVPLNYVAPKGIIILILSIILGIIIPFLIIYIKNLLDTKVKTKQDIVELLNIPYLGDIPTTENPEQLIQLNSRTSTAEALRIIRTNLDFVVSDNNKCKTIFSTSTFPGEGKTFVSSNIAATFALSDKKTLLIGMDIRNPQLGSYFNLPTIGLTNYLSQKNKTIEDYIIKIPNYINFDVLPAGTIPPNPAELLMGEKLAELFTDLKNKYEYIIVDTAPVSLVTDTLLISKFADTFIYVIRSGKLEKKYLEIPESLYNENKLPKMSIVLNDTDTSKGYGYGYGVLNETKKVPFWKKILGLR